MSLRQVVAMISCIVSILAHKTADRHLVPHLTCHINKLSASDWPPSPLPIKVTAC